MQYFQAIYIAIAPFNMFAFGNCIVTVFSVVEIELYCHKSRDV